MVNADQYDLSVFSSPVLIPAPSPSLSPIPRADEPRKKNSHAAEIGAHRPIGITHGRGQAHSCADILSAPAVPGLAFLCLQICAATHPCELDRHQCLTIFVVM